MSDERLKERVRDALASRQREAPPFTRTWAAAEARHRRSRRRYGVTAGVAASVALIAAAFVLWPSDPQQVPAGIVTADALLGTTQWTAPSDVLLPEHRFDIFGDLPVLGESTDLL